VLTSLDLERALARAGLTAPVRADEVTGSTNATALGMAEAGAPEWTLVAAGHQTEGRGRLGRTWEDRPGDALMCSLVLRPGPVLTPARAGLLTLLAGASAALAARELGADVGCKWPNDLMVGEAKAGGILAEASVSGDELRYIVVGLGVNLGEPPPVGGAASLGAMDAPELLAGFLTAFRSRYEPAAPGFGDGVRSIARATSVTLGRQVAATRIDGARVRGRAVDLDPDGGLVVESEGGERDVVAFGEVAHLER
jgi:BirA family transcriptional regulator, biotin operon repressor / biotin---[acetyl-CoA-carboxylase] ligase